MFKLIESPSDDNGTIFMSDMKPCQIGVVEKNGDNQNGHMVMRTATTLKKEVMNLTDPGVGRCWIFYIDDENTGLKVRPLKPGTRITLEAM